MIQSAVVRLSLLYLGIVMVICVGFSLLLYRTASIELERELRQPLSSAAAQAFVGDDFERFREARLNESHARLRANLVLINLLTLAGAGAISYYAARRTLLPIQRAYEAQSRFAADASHELRTPLAAMQTEIEVSLRATSLKKSEMRDLLVSNLEEIGKLQGISENLLKLARQSESDLPLEPVIISEVVANASSRLAKTASQKAVTIHNKAAAVRVLGNQAGLEELFYILLDNAVKYSSVGKKVQITTGIQAKTVTVKVIDEGPGIETDKLQHIFERFYRADSSRTKTAAGGHGLGLAIAANIAKLHRTDIKVKTKVGSGTTFSVQLRKAP